MLFNRPYQPTFAERYPVAVLAAVFDFLLVIGSGYLSFYCRFQTFEMDVRYTLANFSFALLVILSLLLCGSYRSWRGRSFLRQLATLNLGWLTAAGFAFALAFFFKISGVYSRKWFFLMLGVGFATCVLVRAIFFHVLRALRLSGHNLKGVVLVEIDSDASNLNVAESSLREYGYQVSARLKYDSDNVWLNKIVEIVNSSRAHEVWLCLPLSAGSAIKAVLYELRHHTVEIRFIPEWGDIPLLNHRISSIAGLYSLDLSCTPMEGASRFIKRSEDLVIGGLISILIIPVCLLICVAIKVTSPGPVVFKQYRTGINGKRFKVYKFRSMVVHDESSGTVTQATKGDARVTKVGAFLRRTSLDELPQFFNVLQGRMSIVGPRPHALAHNEYYKDLVESYMQRHKVKPGITGWAQVNGYRGETDTLDKMKKRVEYDLWYIDNWSLGLDLKIIVKTVYKGFVGSNAY
ncbi:undecaprenyl-phosphate glucose phosphotransferase [Pseudomonas sp. TTU2014-080ASC]|uniref:undecaprenyl-phosphate glucose phosphotransferase n=1 Tax=Pseudomonas sp. TTU2014-080ASC TaxID=1729724 RepID=UPI0007187CDC|nr:undecaprenyl-phosphate glucose phosphotransferase [Pseudomonas sp. TTU2014-080ASC]KRW62281.1 undecaprenyl-phosphate glucose phosphotransferase [Pseudomonas sp. TTU2014-080ASC]